MTEADEPRLSLRDKAIIAAQGALMAVPFVGSSLEHFIFGPLTELRFRRLEQTLSEVTESLGAEKAQAAVNERFATLLESVAPELGRSVSEGKRQRFRDLLINAAELPEESDEWEEAALASKLLQEMETPALAILAGIARCEPSARATLTSQPVSQVVCGEFDYDNPGEPQHVLPYDWVVVEFWARWLRERRIIHYSSHDARGGFGGVAMADLGRFLVKWTMRDAPAAP
ncbi:MAG TPA: hypothetical protein VNA25_11300 [Phycisphaerae bacterium]|nr:hypothetical protein [Phycisphaerae bacterium]